MSEQTRGDLACDQPSLKILIAEDIEVNQLVTQAILNRIGYTADVVENGLEVLSALEQNVYDVILMDIQMPHLDGLETTRKIRQHYGASKPWIVAVTAHALVGDREKCLDAGMNDYVTKPISVKSISEAIDRCKQALLSEA